MVTYELTASDWIRIIPRQDDVSKTCPECGGDTRAPVDLYKEQDMIFATFICPVCNWTRTLVI